MKDNTYISLESYPLLEHRLLEGHLEVADHFRILLVPREAAPLTVAAQAPRSAELHINLSRGMAALALGVPTRGAVLGGTAKVCNHVGVEV
jgi:hypothetical protein